MKVNMLAGKLDRKITIKQPTKTVDDTTGFQDSSYTTYKTVWAKKLEKNSLERFEGDQLVNVLTTEWHIRYNDAPDLTAKMIITYDGDNYHIVGLKELGRKEGWHIVTSKFDN